MDNREIVEITIKNMRNIFKDTGEIIQIVEEGMKNHGFQPFGIDAACTWDVSRSLKEPGSWLYTYFSRAYSREEDLEKAIGFCIHLGGYSSADIKKLEPLSVKFPFVNVSLLEQKEAFKWKDAKARIEIWDWLWGAGWERAENARRTAKKRTIEEIFEDGAKNLTYFIDLLFLTQKEAIHKLIIEPMKSMYEGDENLVSRNELPTFTLPEAEEG